MNASTAAVLERIFLTVFPLAAVVGVGFGYARRFRPDMDAVNRINLDVFVPALVFSVLSAHAIDFGRFSLLVLAGLLVILGSGALVYPLGRLLGVQARTLLPPMMFRNSGNLGLPVAVLAFGEQALPAAVVLFITTNMTHFSLGVSLLDRRAHPLALLKMPMILAGVAGLLWSASGVALPAAAATFVDMLGQVSIPLMLFALGVRMTSVDLSAWRIGLLGVLVAWLASLVLPLGPELSRSLLLYGALPPAVMNFILAERFGQEPAQVASIVLMGNLASLLFIPLVLFFTL
jgi:predicted permease